MATKVRQSAADMMTGRLNTCILLYNGMIYNTLLCARQTGALAPSSPLACLGPVSIGKV